jgi:hypothetical protein
LLYASPGQINAILPAALQTGQVDIAVTTAEGTGSEPIRIVEARFTAFTVSRLPYGPVLIQQFTASGVTLNRLLDPALPGDTLVFWGTGLGGANPDDVTVFLGGIPVRPIYAGTAPGLPGLDQINLVAPALPNRCFLPVVIRVGARYSAAYTMSAGDARQSACQAEIALAPGALESLDAGGVIPIASLQVVRTPGDALNSAMAEAWEGLYDSTALSVLASYDAQPAAAPMVCSTIAYSFARFSIGTTPPRFPRGFYGLRPSSTLDVSVTGPGNCSWRFSQSEGVVYRATQPLGCPARAYSIRRHNSVFVASGQVPEPLPGTSMPEVTLRSSTEPSGLSWTNAAQAPLAVTLSSRMALPGSIFSGLTYVRQLDCRLSGVAGNEAVPKSDLDWVLNLPADYPPTFRLSSTGVQSRIWGGGLGSLVIRVADETGGSVTMR